MKKRGLEEKELAGEEKRWLGVRRDDCDREWVVGRRQVDLKERNCKEENVDWGEENCRAGENAAGSWENKGTSMFEEDWLILTPNLICLCDISMLTSKEIFTSTYLQ